MLPFPQPADPLAADPMADPLADPMAMDPMAAPVDLLAVPIDPYLDPFGAPPAGLVQSAALPPEAPPPVPEPLPGPTPPLWYVKPPRPKLAEVLEAAERERDDHAERVAMAMEMLDRYNKVVASVYERDKEAVEDGEVEVYPSNLLRAEINTVVAKIAGMDRAVTALFRENFDKGEAAAKEDLAQWLFECEERQHRAGFGENLWEILPKHAMVYGMLVGYDGLDPLDEECGLDMQLVDPATVFPVREGKRGLAAVYQVTNMTAADVVGRFAVGEDAERVEKRVRRVVGAAANGWDPHYEGEVVAYWDRAWCLVAFEGKQILLREHGYARVPFTVLGLSRGQSAATATTGGGVAGTVELDGTPATVLFTRGHTRRADLARIYQPFLWGDRDVHDMIENVGSRLLTAQRRSMNPPIVVKRSVASPHEKVQVDVREGGVTEIMNDEEITVLPNLPSPEVMNPLFTLIQQNVAASVAPGVLMGQAPAQTSGTAYDIMSQSGFERYLPVLQLIEQFLTERMEWRLELLRDWGSILGQDQRRGTLVVPRRAPNRAGVSGAHEITPALLRRTGVRLKVELRKFNAFALPMVGQGLAMLNSLGIISKRRMTEIAGHTTDPEGELQRVEDDALDAVPEVLQARTLRRYVEQAEQALAAGDEESAEELTSEAYFIASQMEANQYRAPIGAMGESPEPPGVPIPPEDAVPPGGAGPGAPPPELQVGGLPLPQVGVMVGQQGGRPPGQAAVPPPQGV